MLARRLTSLPDLEVMGTTCDGERGLRQIEELNPDVVLLDTKACSGNGESKLAILTSYLVGESDEQDLTRASLIGFARTPLGCPEDKEFFVRAGVRPTT